MRSIALFLFIIFLVSLVGCVSMEEPQKVEEEIEAPVQKTLDPDLQEHTFVEEEKVTEEPLCDSSDPPIRYQNCIQDAAVQENDYTLCNVLEDKEECYTYYAETANDKTVCASITDRSEKDSCYSKYGRKYNDIDACLSASSAISKDSCIHSVARATNNIQYCFQIVEDSNIGGCLAVVSYALNDLSFCDNADISSNALDNCYHRLGMLTKDSSWCDKIDDSNPMSRNFAQSCHSTVQAVSS